MTATSDIGATLEFASGAPATFDAAGYAAMTWTKVGGLVSLPEIGSADASVAAPDLETGRTETLKGATTGKTGTVVVKKIASDAGQAAVQAAAATTAENSFKITYADGSIIYITGPVMNWVRLAATDTSYAGFSFDPMSNYAEVYA